MNICQFSGFISEYHLFRNRRAISACLLISAAFCTSFSPSAGASVSLETTIAHDEKAPLNAVSALHIGNEGNLLVLDRERGVLVEYKGKAGTRYDLKKNKVFESGDIRGITRLDDTRFLISSYDDGVIAVIDNEGKLIQKFGESGSREGQLEHPAGIDWSHNG